MKRNILFVIPSLNVGGGEKSLINLLQNIDYSEYEVDLLLFKKTGLFMNLLPSQVKLIDLNSEYKIFQKNIIESIISFIKMRRFDLVINRIVFTFKNRFIKNKNKAEQVSWKNIMKSINVIEKKYDISIGYLEKTSIYFIVDKVNSKKKIGWIHTNYENSHMDANIDQIYFNKLDNIVTISEECFNSLKKVFPQYEKKLKIIYNIVSPKLINNLSKDTNELEIVGSNTGVNITTVARLSHEKGIDNAIKACKELLNRGINVNWYVIGDGPERNNLEMEISKNKLDKHFILLGIKENPYPYIKNSDIYVQPSRYEGKSIAIDEAKILHKPIIITNFDTAKDQIKHSINGLICEMNYIDIANMIEYLINDDNCKERIIKSLEKENLGTEDEIIKLYKLWE